MLKSWLLLVGLLVAAPVAAQPPGYFGIGFPVVAIDQIVLPPVNDGPLVLTGFAFHIGGAAITRINAYMDCDPEAVPPEQCLPLPLVMIQRPEIVSWLAPYRIDAPDFCGFSLVAYGNWGALADGNHLVRLLVTDAEHGRQGWYHFEKRFLKFSFPFPSVQFAK